jgi:hypothetical protein
MYLSNPVEAIVKLLLTIIWQKSEMKIRQIDGGTDRQIVKKTNGKIYR